jgi:mono/diheme cytochrome c family protein
MRPLIAGLAGCVFVIAGCEKPQSPAVQVADSGKLYAEQSYMPAFAGKLSDEEIRAVLAFIASHWTSKELLSARAEMIRNAR